MFLLISYSPVKRNNRVLIAGFSFRQSLHPVKDVAED